MSGMLSWFTGSGAQKRKAAPKDAIVALRAHLEMLQKREHHLQNQMDEQDAIARRNVSSNKNGEGRVSFHTYLTSAWGSFPCFCLLLRPLFPPTVVILLSSQRFLALFLWQSFVMRIMFHRLEDHSLMDDAGYHSGKSGLETKETA